MDSRVFNEILEVIKAEEQRRGSLLQGDHPDAAYAQWIFRHEPLLNELCLMLLATLRHQVERVLVGFAARCFDDGKAISQAAYEARIDQLRPANKPKFWDWNEITRRLNIDPTSPEEECLKGLRLLTNAYKHDPLGEPSDELKRFLSHPEVNFAPLPESDLLQKELAKFVGLDKDASYPEIVEGYLASVNEYLSDLESRNSLSEIKPFPAPMDPKKLWH